MKFYILELFLNSGEDFQNIFHFKNFFFEEKYFEKLHPLTEKVPKCKISFSFPQILIKLSTILSKMKKIFPPEIEIFRRKISSPKK